MATKVAQRRLHKEYLVMQKSPPPFIWACPEEKNILDWHFIIRGPPDSLYAGGEYHGLIWFPSDYPFKPPDVKMFTPSGRFETGHKICMSMTSYHPSTWNAAWSVATILTGLLSFMLSDEITAGAVRTTDAEKRTLAKQSHAFNLSNRKFKEVFPSYANPEMTDLPDMGIPSNPSVSLFLRHTIVLLLILWDETTEGLNPSDPTSTEPSNPSTSALTPFDSLGLVNETPKPPDERKVRAHPRPAWMPSWRWVIAVVVLAVLGRLSTFAGF
ncbi:MAG: Ubiquitin-conjugating enzyme E2 6 [Tremellales sp. Tagirdzhanova-0007]|nr:MAG: Ubiquitin-conjugating enzyme E2 6 [Tremellales sp. Tagirdzhanova-0007]